MQILFRESPGTEYGLQRCLVAVVAVGIIVTGRVYIGEGTLWS